MSASLEDRVRRVVSDVFGVPLGRVTATTSRDDVETWDSVNVVNLLMALEGEFGVSISIDEAADLMSVPIIVALLVEKGAA